MQYISSVDRLTGSSPRRADGDDAACDVDNDVVDQQLAAAGRLHQGHRRLVEPLRHLRLLGVAGVRARQLRCQVTRILNHLFNQLQFFLTIIFRSVLEKSPAYEVFNEEMLRHPTILLTRI